MWKKWGRVCEKLISNCTPAAAHSESVAHWLIHRCYWLPAQKLPWATVDRWHVVVISKTQCAIQRLMRNDRHAWNNRWAPGGGRLEDLLHLDAPSESWLTAGHRPPNFLLCQKNDPLCTSVLRLPRMSHNDSTYRTHSRWCVMLFTLHCLLVTSNRSCSAVLYL